MTETGKSDLRAVESENIHWDQDISYGGYLNLDKLLDCQNPRTDSHDEMLFLVIHQASELWMKLCIHELAAAMEHIKNDNLGASFKMLARISRIQGQLRQSWDVLSTMTPSDYSSFRDKLGQSSGFQSFQYRAIEFALGNKNAKLLEVHRSKPERYEPLKATLEAPSIYDLCIELLSKRGFNIPEECLNRDWSLPYEPSDAVEAAWATVYRETGKYWELYELAEKLVDLEHQFQMWRFSHMKTVERIIGYRKGTGGTGGVSFLVKALDLRFFPELWNVRTGL
ncbi:tryptophan 2,3-dioxygenase [Kordiimonas laminariae]|uniref:tryptophan 2,3-dioxygenase n=1 Tax=Kordiimonas laminariae TaxID=2917717 RepID=UPI001FF62CDE|nr:tryptophan 2,3-dioxygenase [Kordiimonas laminariae]MCK0070026.1 tryptophan 2,3-dioxygenase [Kordiimonas laminariae]